MAKRTDQLQLEIIIDGKKAGTTYKQLKDEARGLAAQLDRLAPGTEAFSKKAAELKQVNSRLAEIRQQTRGVSQGMNEMRTSSSRLTDTFKKMTSALSWAGLILLVKQSVQAVWNFGKETLKLYDAQAKADAQLKAAIISTNGAAGRSFEQLKKQASELQKQTLFGDEQTQEAQGILLTFTKVREEIYDRSIPAILDYATAMKTDLKSASVQVGKALNDPIKGVTALSKAGVQFTADQKTMIASMVEAGDIAGAQTIILKELETQFNGSAKAAAEAGMGPYQQLSNRMSDIKEAVGSLIEKGLARLQPFFRSAVEFLENFTSSVVSGEKAQGRFGLAINAIIAYGKVMFRTFEIAWNILKFGIGIITNLIKKIYEFRLIRNVIDGVVSYFKALYNVMMNSGAVFEGFKAAVSQVIENIRIFFQKLIIDAEIMAKKLERFLTIKPANRKVLDAEIKALESRKTAYSKAGKTAGQAYREAYNAEVNRAAILKKAKELGSTSTTTTTTTNTDDTTTTDKNKKVEDPIKKGLDELEKTLKRQQNITEKQYQQNLISQQDYEAKQRQNKIDSLNAQLEFLKANGQAESDLYLEKEVEILRIDKEAAASKQAQALKALEDQNKAENDALETQLLQKEITQKAYDEQKLQLRAQQLQKELDLMASFGLQETDKYRAARLELLKINNEIENQAFADRKAALQNELDSYLDAEQKRFLRGLIDEEEYNNKKLQIREAYLQKELDALEASGQEGTQLYKQIEIQLLEVKKEMTDQRIAQIKREQEMQDHLQGQTIDMLQKTFDVGIELLSKDEDARRKNMNTIKAFQIAQVTINSADEISGLWKNAQSNPLNAIIPGWGSIYAGIMTGISLARTAAAIQKINSTKYWQGGYTGSGSKYDPAGVVHKGEIVWSQEDIARHGGVMAVEQMRLSRGYMTGGFVTARDTTPIGVANVPINNAGSAQDSALINYIRELIKEVRRIPDNIRAYIVYEELQAKDREMASILNKASI